MSLIRSVNILASPDCTYSGKPPQSKYFSIVSTEAVCLVKPRNSVYENGYT